MKCLAYVVDRNYGQPGPCERRDVKMVRWAPTPLTTKRMMLCSVHMRRLERDGTVPLAPTPVNGSARPRPAHLGTRGPKLVAA